MPLEMSIDCMEISQKCIHIVVYYTITIRNKAETDFRRTDKNKIDSSICDSHDSRLIQTVSNHKNVPNVGWDASVRYLRMFFFFSCMPKIRKLAGNTNEVKKLGLNSPHV